MTLKIYLYLPAGEWHNKIYNFLHFWRFITCSFANWCMNIFEINGFFFLSKVLGLAFWKQNPQRKAAITQRAIWTENPEKAWRTFPASLNLKIFFWHHMQMLKFVLFRTKHVSYRSRPSTRNNNLILFYKLKLDKKRPKPESWNQICVSLKNSHIKKIPKIALSRMVWISRGTCRYNN